MIKADEPRIGRPPVDEPLNQRVSVPVCMRMKRKIKQLGNGNSSLALRLLVDQAPDDGRFFQTHDGLWIMGKVPIDTPAPDTGEQDV